MKKITKRVIALLIMFSMTICCVMGNEMNPAYAEETSKNLVVKAENSLNGSIEMEISITASWDNHYNADVTLRNKLNEKIDNWMIAFDFNNNIENIWNAKIISHEKNHYVVKNADWNQDIPVRGQITFGMTVSYEEEVSNLTNYYDATDLIEVERDYDITYTQFAQWDNKINGQITIQNNSEEDIEDWRLELLSDVDFDNVWNAELLECADGYSYLENMSYNQNIPAGGSVSFGFIATCEKTPDFSEHILYEIGEVQKDSADEDEEEEEEYYDGDVIWGEEDFQSPEDYQEYLKSIGGYASISYKQSRRLSKTRDSWIGCEEEYTVEDIGDQYKIQISPSEEYLIKPKGKAFQNFCISGNYMYATQHDGLNTNLLRFELNKKKYTATYKDGMVLVGFGHGQSLQRFTHTLDGTKKTYFLLTCNPYIVSDVKGLKNDHWGTEVACIEYKKNTVLKYDTQNPTPGYGLLTDLEYATDSSKSNGGIKRIDIGLYSKTRLALWKMKTNRDIQLVIYDFGKFIDKLCNKQKVSLKVSKIKPQYYRWCKEGSEKWSYVYPDKSMQGIDIYGSNTIFITSGNQSNNMPLKLSKLYCKGKKLQQKHVYKLNTITDIFTDKKVEVEGVQASKNKVYICFTPCNASEISGKFPQYVLSIYS